MESAPGPDDPENSRADDAELIQTLRDLAEDAQTLVQAEIAFQQARAIYAWNRSKGIALLIAAGLVFGFFTLVALVVGLLLALAHDLGVWGALAVVAGGLGLITMLSFAVAALRIKRLRGMLAAKGEQP